MISENQRYFEKWYRDFLKENRRTRSSVGTREWFRKVQQSKSDLRDVLGNVRTTQKITLKHDDPDLIDTSTIANYISDVLYYLPNYLKRYPDIKTDDLYKPFLPNGMRTSKHILGYLDRATKEDFLPYYDKNYTRIHIESYLSRIGELWNIKSVDRDLYVTISTSARAFAKLGHYSVDNGSCFGEHGCNRRHKYILGQSPNTFVALISAVEKEEIEKDVENLSRCWGFADKDFNKFSFCNIYSKSSLSTKQLNKKEVQKAMKLAFSQVFKKDKLNQISRSLSIQKVYYNGDGVTLYDPDKITHNYMNVLTVDQVFGTKKKVVV